MNLSKQKHNNFHNSQQNFDYEKNNYQQQQKETQNQNPLIQIKHSNGQYPAISFDDKNYNLESLGQKSNNLNSSFNDQSNIQLVQGKYQQSPSSKNELNNLNYTMLSKQQNSFRQSIQNQALLYRNQRGEYNDEEQTQLKINLQGSQNHNTGLNYSDINSQKYKSQNGENFNEESSNVFSPSSAFTGNNSAKNGKYLKKTRSKNFSNFLLNLNSQNSKNYNTPKLDSRKLSCNRNLKNIMGMEDKNYQKNRKSDIFTEQYIEQIIQQRKNSEGLGQKLLNVGIMKITQKLMSDSFQPRKSKTDFEVPKIPFGKAKFFTIDILLQFNTAMYIKGILVKDKLVLGKKYLKSYFVLDLLTVVGLMCVQTFSSQWFELAFVFRLVQLRSRLEKLNKYFSLKYKMGFNYDFILIISVILLMAHITGCGFYQIGQYDKFYGKYTWIDFFNMEQLEIWDKYVTSLYFTFVTMITVGYGDIYPISTNEKIYVIFMTIVSCGIFGYCVNRLSQLFNQINERKKKIERKQDVISKYLKQRQINQFIQTDILKYIEYQNQGEASIEEEGAKIISELDNKLIEDYKITYFTKFLQQKRFFFQNFSKKSIHDLSLHMEEVIYKKGEIIFLEDTLVDKLMILIQGSVVFFSKKNNQLFLGKTEMTSNKIVNLDDFIGNKCNQNSARADDLCKIAFINKENFIEILKKNENDYSSSQSEDIFNIHNIQYKPNDPLLDFNFYKLIPKIKNNVVNLEQLEKIQNQEERIKEIEEANNIQQNDEKLWYEIEKLRDLQSEISQDEDEDDQFGFQDIDDENANKMLGIRSNSKKLSITSDQNIPMLNSYQHNPNQVKFVNRRESIKEQIDEEDEYSNIDRKQTIILNQQQTQTNNNNNNKSHNRQNNFMNQTNYSNKGIQGNLKSQKQNYQNNQELKFYQNQNFQMHTNENFDPMAGSYQKYNSIFNMNNPKNATRNGRNKPTALKRQQDSQFQRKITQENNTNTQEYLNQLLQYQQQLQAQLQEQNLEKIDLWLDQFYQIDKMKETKNFKIHNNYKKIIQEFNLYQTWNFNIKYEYSGNQNESKQIKKRNKKIYK
ncbi:Cyclic nucleotide-binding protein [Pseudocohnilembus persalinus]|uniref:Cyclic nucleotide-binding protein n=1 Tax=Pseudocohnilembus persalinus TaxID=266149 RepID=A0A0V0QXK9_PSEPJ|nr:Cyclic nucleotide-binding protein [Pseudocohnilembus persalinus]|eukprot:KRX07015.1 Cyclic nucleotide-binding protein [Pseudocohnilembus persalinus]